MISHAITVGMRLRTWLARGSAGLPTEFARPKLSFESGECSRTLLGRGQTREVHKSLVTKQGRALDLRRST